MMVLYFSIIGGLFYKLFITPPYEQKNAIKSEKLVIVKKNVGDIHA